MLLTTARRSYPVLCLPIRKRRCHGKQYVVADTGESKLDLIEAARHGRMAVAEQELNAPLQHQFLAGTQIVGIDLYRPQPQLGLDAARPTGEKLRDNTCVAASCSWAARAFRRKSSSRYSNSSTAG
jgi:hypothetical protein